MFSADKWFGTPNFYNGIATQSLRLDGGTEITLDNSGAATSNKIATISTWFKRADEVTTLAYLFHSKNDGSFGDGSSGLASFSITLDADDGISVVQYNGNPSFGADQYDFGVKIQNRVFRDPGAWYHLVVAIDTTQGSGTTNEADRIKMYVNGTQQTVVAINDGSGSQDFADENQILAINQDGEQRWGGTVDDGTYAHVYLAETNVVDGLQLDASYFGETKNGVWIPIVPNVSEYGNHGYRLEFKETGVGAGASNTVGADTSSKNNHFTTHSNIGAHDCNIPDSPENNFAVFNTIIRPYAVTPAEAISDGSLNTYFNSSGVSGSYWSTFLLTKGKWYFEVNVVAAGGNADVGINNKPSDAGRGTYTGDARGNGYFYQKDGQKGIDNTFSSYGATYTTGDIIGCAFDLDNNTITFYKDNVPQGQITGVATAEDGFIPAIEGFNGTRLIANFGQDSSFNNDKTAQGNKDVNGIGDFYYTPPGDHLAICTANMEDPNIGPNSDTNSVDHFNTVTYVGDEGTQAITGVGFKPDWLWIKVTDETNSHYLFDSSRGEDKAIFSDSNAAEVDYSSTGRMTAFGVDGFTVKTSSSTGTNGNDDNYVAWSWKANGGITSSNGNGSIASTVQVNETAGFSIVTFTGNGANDATIGHGLSSTPELIITKNRDETQHWRVHHKDLTANYVLYLAENYYQIAPNGSNNGYIKTVGPSTYSTYESNVDSLAVNGSGDNMVSYCFTGIEGYSKFGKYLGNGHSSNNPTDGTFVYLGFRPAFLIYKIISDNGNWLIDDDVTQTFNPDSNYLVADNTDPQGDTTTNTAGHAFDMLSNGFKFRNYNASRNDNGDTYVYIAFARTPFKYANAR